jgi:hypothetical protein
VRLPLLTLSFALALAAPAAADSIVFVKDANVWVARPDGSEARALTTDGTPQLPYGSPSQADDGTVLAVRGSRLHKLDRQGKPLASFDSLLTKSTGGAVGPFDARISPDGTKFAYWLGIMGGWYDYATNTTYTNPQSSVAFQSALDGTPLGTTMFYEEPSWIDGNRLLLFDSQNGGVPQVVSGGVGTNHNNVTGWFHDLDTFAEPGGWHPVGAGELTRDGKRLAALRAGGTMGAGFEARGKFNSIQLYTVSGLDAKPQPTCALRDSDGVEFASPTWSPGGDALAWATPAGIYSTPLGPNCEGFVERLVVPGGREPDWGPADPGATAAAPQQPASQPATPAPRIARVRVRGRKVTVKLSCACKATVVARKGKRVVARGKGTGQITLRVRARGKVKLTVTTGATKLTKTVKLR